MTVPSNTAKAGPYDGNGSTTVFGYEFRIWDEAHLRVILTDVNKDETVLALSSDYTVSGVGNADGGNVTVSVAPATGETLTVLRNVPFVQEIDLENQGAYYAETVERGFDLAAMRAQQLAEEVSRAVKVPAEMSESDLDGLIADVIRLAASASAVDTVAGISADVTAVAGVSADVTIVAGIASDVTTVAGIASEVQDAEANATAATAAAASTAADAVATAADRVQTGLDRTATNAALTATTAARDQTLEAFDNFDDRYLGAKASDPATDNDGDPLVAGALYFNSTAEEMRLYTGSAWVAAYVSPTGLLQVNANLSDLQDVDTALTNLGFGDTGKSLRAASSSAEARAILSLSYSSQVQAEAGSTSSTVMTPLRVKQAIDYNLAELDVPVRAVVDDDGWVGGGGSYSPTPTGGNAKEVENVGGASGFTFSAEGGNSDTYSMVVKVVNSASAGDINFVGFAVVDGDPLTSVDGDEFLIFITNFAGTSIATVKALQ